MARDSERSSRSGEAPIVGGLPDVPGILAAMRLTRSLETGRDAQVTAIPR